MVSSKSKTPPITIYTLGHSNRPIEEFLSLVAQNRITLLADVRAFPGSRHNPQYQPDTLVRHLKPIGISYKHFPDLGGRRKAVEGSANTGWNNKSFQGYADYMRTQPFKEALRELIAIASQMRTVIVCAEAVPWRCHRNLISDALTIEGLNVEHILSRTQNRTQRFVEFRSWARTWSYH